MDPRFVDKTRFVDGFLVQEKSTNRVCQAEIFIPRTPLMSRMQVLFLMKNYCTIIIFILNTEGVGYVVSFTYPVCGRFLGKNQQIGECIQCTV